MKEFKTIDWGPLKGWVALGGHEGVEGICPQEVWDRAAVGRIDVTGDRFAELSSEDYDRVHFTCCDDDGYIALMALGIYEDGLKLSEVDPMYLSQCILDALFGRGE